MTNTTTAATTTAIAEDRNATIAEIERALKARSGKAWSVTGGQGTAWGWITISAPPARRGESGQMSVEDIAELSMLLGTAVHHQGEHVPASRAHRREYIERANGRPAADTPAYWD